MKILKVVLLLSTMCACHTLKYDFGNASSFFPSKKILKEGIVNKYYVHQKEHNSENIGTGIEYGSYKVENNKLLYSHFRPDYSLNASRTFSFEDNKMILLKEVTHTGKDTLVAKISEPIVKDWASQHSYLETETRYNNGWKLHSHSKQERSIDTVFLNKRSKLFEGKIFRTSSNEEDTIKKSIKYKQIYVENLGLSYIELEDSINRYWIELVEQIPLKEFNRQARHGLHRVAYIDPNKTIDKNETFDLCLVNDRIYDYYNSEHTIHYNGGKKALWKTVNKYLDVEKLSAESGYLTFRFIVNCIGETGRFITEEANLNYEKKTFNETTVNHFYEILQEMTDWVPTKIKGDDVDAYFYLTFKLKNGKVVELLP